MAKITGLGKGLGSLIPKKIPDSIISGRNKDFLVGDTDGKILKVPVDMISVNPQQPRNVFNHEDLESLMESIKIHGIIQPLIVTQVEGGYELIAGERRLRSAKILGLNTVPVIVREAEEQEKLEIALIENVQRKNLNPMEKAVAYNRLMEEFSLSQEVAAKKLGVSRSSLANTVRFLELPEKVQAALAEETITEGHAKVIAGLSDEKSQLSLLDNILKNNYTVRDIEKQIKQPTQPKKPRILEPLIQEKQDILRSKLNTKVNIYKKGGQGQIIIEFYSDEELDSIIDQII